MRGGGAKRRRGEEEEEAMCDVSFIYEINGNNQSGNLIY